MNKYLPLIRQNICSICADSSEDGECTLTEQEICAIEEFLPQIVEVVHSIKSDDNKEYVAALKKTVCEAKCKTQDGDYCYLRQDANCALDRYFPIIVELIQKADQPA